MRVCVFETWPSASCACRAQPRVRLFNQSRERARAEQQSCPVVARPGEHQVSGKCKKQTDRTGASCHLGKTLYVLFYSRRQQECFSFFYINRTNASFRVEV